MHRGFLTVALLVLAVPLGAQGVDEASLEARMEALSEAFSPIARSWESLTAQGASLTWKTGFFEAFEDGKILIQEIRLLEIGEKVRRGEPLTARSSPARDSLPDIVAHTLSSDVRFFTSTGRQITQVDLKGLGKPPVALGRHPETGKVVMVVVLEEPTLQTLGEQYRRKLQEFTARE